MATRCTLKMGGNVLNACIKPSSRTGAELETLYTGTMHPHQISLPIGPRRQNRSKPRVETTPSLTHLRHNLRLSCINMNDIRDSFSKLKKRLKYPLKGGTRKPEKTGSNAIGEGFSQTSSLPYSESDVVVGGNDDREGKGADAGEDQPLRRDEPEFTPIGEIDNHQEWGEKEGCGKEVSQGQHSHPDVEPVAGSEELERVSPSATSIFHSGKWTDSMCIWLFWLLPLTNPPNNVVTASVPDHVSKAESSMTSAHADENKTSWKFAASAAAKLLLRGVSSTADAFGPLKSVAGGLCFILENCEVCLAFRIHYLRSL